MGLEEEPILSRSHTSAWFTAVTPGDEHAPLSRCGGLSETCPPRAHVFKLFIPSWWRYLRTLWNLWEMQCFAGGSMSTEQVCSTSCALCFLRVDENVVFLLLPPCNAFPTRGFLSVTFNINPIFSKLPLVIVGFFGNQQIVTKTPDFLCGVTLSSSFILSRTLWKEVMMCTALHVGSRESM